MTNSDIPDASKIRADALRVTGIDLPINGGSGQSERDPIMIQESDPSKSAAIEWDVVRFINQAAGREWKFVHARHYNLDSKVIEQFKVKYSHDPNNYYNFYFDVTMSLGGNK